MSEGLARLVLPLFDPAMVEKHVWIRLHVHHGFQMLLAVVAMLLAGGGRESVGFRLKSADLRLVPAVAVGLLFGFVMTAVDHLPAVLAGSPITGSELTATNVAGWLSFEWIVAGLSEEILLLFLLIWWGFQPRRPPFLLIVS